MNNKKIAVIGLGYVGLPLAIEFGKKRTVLGYDINQKRIEELKQGIDVTLEMSKQDFKKSAHLSYTANTDELKDCSIFIVTVPTPIDKHKKPDLNLLKKASDSIGKIIKKDDIVIYESTVYPGATEEICVPILEKQSGLIFNKDFYCGYSPERINPGDKSHRIADIKKITSGSTPEIATEIDELYQEIVIAGTHMTSSIKIAEAAKVIENTQRDLNIALINEFALIFNKLDIDTESVLKAAGTKWNFLQYRPGLVGGHCIGVDPYYLTYKANEVGYHPEMILAGRKINDNMGIYVAQQVSKLMIKKKIDIVDANVLIMGLTFKENCPDHRNTRVADLVEKIKSFNCNVDVYDPWVNKDQVNHDYNIQMVNKPIKGKYDAIIIAVAHDEFKSLTQDEIKSYGKDDHILYDIKYVLNANDSDGRL
ncbi:Vi polysaccharide biosynthesis UDP-N-acetylglucosamine C-6 dehydrogenase TviB [Candidatus Pelagibacter sp. Uisw_090]|uniref:Vi polysaccharide biosynthesis UDP-N-acetylglucosamine C-6 dehydrogenase TviB n=1 Tax=Candidatus Pelagibacter sp. Uisw_090 TaxID=3230993 RepID=UPI0039ED1C42